MVRRPLVQPMFNVYAKTIPLIAALLCVGGSLAEGGLCSRRAACDDSCAAGCRTDACCPADYCCKCESEEVDVTRQCFETECKAIAIPAIKMPCFKCKLKNVFRGRLGSHDGCGGCGHSGCESGCSGGLLNKLCSGLTACRVRCVNTYQKKEYDCGKKCVCKWSAEPRRGGSCAPFGCTP